MTQIVPLQEGVRIKMANIDMKTTGLFDAILGSSGHVGVATVARGTEGSAMGYVTQLRDVLSQIQKTAERLNAEWDDDAQRVFMQKFTENRKIIETYLIDLAALLCDLHKGVYDFNQFDIALAGKLSSGNLANY